MGASTVTKAASVGYGEFTRTVQQRRVVLHLLESCLAYKVTRAPLKLGLVCIEVAGSPLTSQNAHIRQID